MTHVLKKLATRPGWAAQKAYLWGRSIAGLNRSDIIFAFYPKTGSTWVRLFFFNFLSARENVPMSGLSFDAVDAAMPEFGNPSFFLPWPFAEAPRLVKTHRPYNRFFGARQSVLFVREPRDTMISFLHYANAKKVFQFSGGLDDLLHHPEMGLDAYFRFYASWMEHAGLLVRYEDLRQSPVETFSGILDHIGIKADAGSVSKALEASSLDKTRKAQQVSSSQFKEQFKDGFVFARKGSIGEGKEQFTPAQEAYYQDRRRHWGFTLYD